MNIELWNKIESFDFDEPFTEYGFSTRLAKENYWTENFTATAILEYKKFMYLAATSEMMVSPSEIVDIVWHQHLIFTQSYQEFCSILGTQIQHIPSQHNKEEYNKFLLAKDRTTALYNQIFGEQPSCIWNEKQMFDSLNLNESSIGLKTYTLLLITCFLLLFAPFFLILKPIVSTIESDDFLVSFVFIAMASFLILAIINNNQIKKMVSQIKKDAFIFSLTPYELVYLKTSKLFDVANSVTNSLIKQEVIKINNDKSFLLLDHKTNLNKIQKQVLLTLKQTTNAYYYILSETLIQKPVFENIKTSVDAFVNFTKKSKFFVKIYYTNFLIILLLFFALTTRVLTGISRDKPIEIISLLILAFIIFSCYWLYNLSKNAIRNVITNLYTNKIIPSYRTNNKLSSASAKNDEQAHSSAW